jgi:hypothetical protein
MDKRRRQEMKQNCWEFRKCGRDKESDIGICPAVTEIYANSINSGKNGGRICWAVPGTHCDDKIQGTYAQKVLMCRECDFRWKVQEEEGSSFKLIYFTY